MKRWMIEKATGSRFRARIESGVSYFITKHIFSQDPEVLSALALQYVWLRTNNHALGQISKQILLNSYILCTVAPQSNSLQFSSFNFFVSFNLEGNGARPRGMDVSAIFSVLCEMCNLRKSNNIDRNRRHGAFCQELAQQTSFITH